MNSGAEFDFDEWAKLAKENPDAFENKRQQMIQDVIDTSFAKDQTSHARSSMANRPDSRYSQQIQWPSCLKISQMMWDKTIGEDGLVDHLQQLTDASHNRDTSNQIKAIGYDN